MLYTLVDKPVPDAIAKRNSRLNCSFIFLNAFIPFLEGIDYFIANRTTENKPNSPYKLILISFVSIKLCVSALQFTSTLFLGCGINRIRQIIRLSDDMNLLNVSILVQHFLVFALYTLSTLLQFFTFTSYYLLGGDLIILTVSIAVSNLLSFFEQLAICHIFMQLARGPAETK
jgi:hypothetical protein